MSDMEKYSLSGLGQASYLHAALRVVLMGEVAASASDKALAAQLQPEKLALADMAEALGLLACEIATRLAQAAPEEQREALLAQHAQWATADFQTLADLSEGNPGGTYALKAMLIVPLLAESVRKMADKPKLDPEQVQAIAGLALTTQQTYLLCQKKVLEDPETRAKMEAGEPFVVVAPMGKDGYLHEQAVAIFTEEQIPDWITGNDRLALIIEFREEARIRAARKSPFGDG